jgi:hypothetical protein
MSKESIFHKLIKNENSYTQLLSNILMRNGGFRGDFLDLFDKHLKERVEPTNIRTQVALPQCGQVDILIRSPGLCIIVEVKTELGRAVTEKQRLLDNPASYQLWLERQKAAGSEAWLIFLVPASWKYRPETEKEIQGYRRRGLEKGVRVDQVLWEELLPLLLENTKESEFSLLLEFRLFLEERFGPIGFDKKETMSMFNDKFPVPTVLKLITLIDKVRQEVAKNSKIDISKDEIGSYFTKEGKEETCRLYFGCWLQFWENNHHPICFGASDVSHDVKEAFVKSLKRVYKQDPIPCGDYLMGWIPEEDLNKSNAFEEISPKLKTIWKSMLDAAD